MSFWALKADFTVSGYYSVYYYMQEQEFKHFRSIRFFAIDVYKRQATQMGKLYQRLIVDTTLWNENYVDEIYRVYNSDICDIIDN